MFSSHLSAFGLDLSDLSIKLAWLKKRGSKKYLASFAREDIPEKVIESGVIKKEEELIDAIKKTITQAKGEKITAKKCIISLPETESYIRMIQIPKIKTGEISEAIKWEVEANIPVSINDVYYDWQIIDTGCGPSNFFDVLIGALPKSLVDPYLMALKKAGLYPLVFEIESIATARSLIKQSSQHDPLMIIDLGAKRTSIIIFMCGAVWFTTSIPISNNLLINEVSKDLKVSIGEAKALKFKIGIDLAKDKRAVFKAVEPELLELVSEIKKYLDYYQEDLMPRHPNRKPINKILLCGGGANLRGLPGFLSSSLKVIVEHGNPWVNVLSPDDKDLPDLSFSESLTYATALGLALRGIEEKN